MTNELMHKHHKCLSILRMIKEEEGKIKNAHDFLKATDNPFYYEFNNDYIHNIEIYTMTIKRLFERHELLIEKLT